MNWNKKTRKDFIIYKVNLPYFMEYFKRISPEWYVERGNKNEVKGRIDKFAEYVKSGKPITASDFNFSMNKDFSLKLNCIDGRHRMAYFIEKGIKQVYIQIPKVQKSLFDGVIKELLPNYIWFSKK